MAGNVPPITEKNSLRIVQAIRDLFAGRSNAVGTVTLSAGAGSTVVAAPNIGLDSRPVLTPATASAAAEYGNGTIYVSAVDRGAFTITHANNADTDKIFYWHAFG